jgi:hypothetical protein
VVDAAKYQEWPLEIAFARRLRGFLASPDISRHRSNVIEVETALRAPSLDPSRDFCAELLVEAIGY